MLTVLSTTAELPSEGPGAELNKATCLVSNVASGVVVGAGNWAATEPERIHSLPLKLDAANALVEIKLATAAESNEIPVVFNRGS